VGRHDHRSEHPGCRQNTDNEPAQRSGSNRKRANGGGNGYRYGELKMRHAPWILAALIFAPAMAPLLYAGETPSLACVGCHARRSGGMDVASSRGGVEANPLMKHGGVAIKVSAVER